MSEEKKVPEATSIAKKFTTRSLGFDSEACKELVRTSKGEVEIFNVLALISGKKVEPNRIDPSKTSTRFFGQFEVVNRLTGEQGMFPEAYFPGVVESYVSAMKDGAGEGNAILPFIITVMKDDTKNSAQGYKFGVKAFVQKAGDADPFKGVRDLLPKVEPKKALAAGKSK